MAPVIVSPADKRSYRHLQLENGLQVLLIHDPDIEHDGGEACAEEEGRRSQRGEKHLHADAEELEDLMTSEEDSGDSSIFSDEESDEESDDASEASSSGRGAPKPAKHAAAVKKAAAALSVGVGQYSDPWDLQGLGHYVEHMLFMGSAKYPDENDYDAFLTAQGGSSNAHTASECTTFYFDVRPSALEPALDRFAQFFVSPLLKADALDRELCAVDSEFCQVRQSDVCRLEAVRSHSARRAHVARKFAWGDARSLRDAPRAAGVDVRARLEAHYRSEYGASRSRLVVLGGAPLEALERCVRASFGAVAGSTAPRPTFGAQGAPHVPGTMHLVPGVREGHRLSLLFQWPCLHSRYEAKADDLLSHLVGHEGPGSLLSALKARGLASELTAGVEEHSSVAALFDVTLTLTEQGLAHGPGSGLGVAALVFAYLAALRAAGPRRWVWDEMAALAGVRFRFAEEEEAIEYVSSLAQDMFLYRPEHVVAAAAVYSDWDPELVESLLAKMTPGNCRVDLQTHDFEAQSLLWNQRFADCAVQHEPWFELDYLVADVPRDLLAAWEAAAPATDMALPAPNPYIPSDFALRCDGAGEKAGEEGEKEPRPVCPPALATSSPAPPSLLLAAPGVRVWHKLDAAFRQPRACAYVRLASPALYASARAAAAAHLALKLLEDSLCESLYYADLAGLSCSTWFEGPAGLDVRVEGFSHRADALLDLVLRSLRRLRPAAGSGKRVLEALRRQYANVNMKPAKHATYLRLAVLKKTVFGCDEVLRELDEDLLAEIPGFIDRVLSGADLAVDVLLHGNVSALEAHAAALRAVRSLEMRVPVAGLEQGKEQGKEQGAGEASPCSPLGLDSPPLTSETVLAALPSLAALPCPVPRPPQVRCTRLPSRCDWLLRAPVKNPAERTSAVEIYYQCGRDSTAERVLLDCVCQLLHEPCYDELRTKEQLGYTVHSGLRCTHGLLGLAVVVVSASHGAAHVDARVEAFLEGQRARLRSLPAEEFEAHRVALRSVKLQKDRALVDECDRAWEEIVSLRRSFGARAAEVAAIDALSQAQVVEYFERVCCAGGSQRRKLAVHVLGAQEGAESLAAPPPEGTALLGADWEAAKDALESVGVEEGPLGEPILDWVLAEGAE